MFMSLEQTNTSPSSKPHHILIVDDDNTIRESMVRYLENFHKTTVPISIHSVSDAPEAYELIQKNTYDLVISDINLPHEDGFKVLQAVRRASENTRIALITAYRVEDYIRLAKETGIYNIIAKTAPFNFDELSNVVNNLLHPETAFGLAPYFSESESFQEFTIENSQQIMEVFNTLRAFFEASKVKSLDTLSTALIEALTNAVYHAAKNPDGTLKYRKGQEIKSLEPHEKVSVYYGKDTERVGVCIVDQGGRITAEEILFWLDRNISGAGLLDSHGRGVYLMHTLVDRLIININPQKRTEIIVLDYFSPEYSSNKPLYINQL